VSSTTPYYNRFSCCHGADDAYAGPLRPKDTDLGERWGVFLTVVKNLLH